MPKSNYLELCAQYVLEYERKMLLHKIKHKIKITPKRNETTLKLKHNHYEYICPFELKKHNSIIFRLTSLPVHNNNTINHNNKQLQSYEVGALLGRHSCCGKDEGYFKITNGLKYTPKENGVLFIKLNYDWYSKFNDNNNSMFSDNKKDEQQVLTIALAVKVNSVIPLYKRIGFDNIEELLQNEKHNNIGHIHNITLITFINMLRTNPSVFAKVYIEHLLKDNCDDNIQSLYEMLINMNKRDMLKESAFLMKLSRMLCEDLVKTKRFSLYDSMYRNVSDRARFLINENKYTRKSNYSSKEEFDDLEESIMMMTGNEDIQDKGYLIEIVLKLLFDELIPSRSNRKNILNKYFNYCGYCIMDHSLFGSIAVITFSQKHYEYDTDN